MTGRIFEAGHTTAPDHMPERAKNRLHPRGRPHTYGPAALPRVITRPHSVCYPNRTLLSPRYARQGGGAGRLQLNRDVGVSKVSSTLLFSKAGPVFKTLAKPRLTSGLSDTTTKNARRERRALII
jgi:hypothetical protein